MERLERLLWRAMTGFRRPEGDFRAIGAWICKWRVGWEMEWESATDRRSGGLKATVLASLQDAFL
jgi:hypothetical protein